MLNVDKRTSVAILSVLSNTFLIILKLVAGILSGSVSIISEAIHSSVDLLASVVALFSVRYSRKPADERHPYGHGKIENISGMIEGILIFVAAILIIIEAVRKMFSPEPMQSPYIAIAVMFISAIVNFFVSRRLHVVAKAEDSMALEADSVHLKTDIYTSLGVGIGIILIVVTGIHILDSIVAIVVAIMILKEGVELVLKASDEILDAKLSDEEEEKIIKIIESHSDKILDYHKLKTRKSGNIKHIDFHIMVNCNMTVKQAHSLIAKIKEEMNTELKNTRISIHVDPNEH